jgi:hypothetical protein
MGRFKLHTTEEQKRLRAEAYRRLRSGGVSVETARLVRDWSEYHIGLYLDSFKNSRRESSEDCVIRESV